MQRILVSSDADQMRYKTSCDVQCYKVCASVPTNILNSVEMCGEDRNNLFKHLSVVQILKFVRLL